MATNDSVSWKILRPRRLWPGGLKITAGGSGLARVELWSEMEPRWRSLGDGFEVAEGGPAHPALEQAAEELAAYFEGRRRRFETPLEMSGSPFQLRVWRLLRRIPYGQTWAYGELAERVGSYGGARAVGQAVGRNPLPIFLPCHRVVGSGGHLTGFSCGLGLKVKLLELEGLRLSAGRNASRRRVCASSGGGRDAVEVSA